MQHKTHSFSQKSYTAHRYKCLCSCNRWTYFYYVAVFTILM